MRLSILLVQIRGLLKWKTMFYKKQIWEQRLAKVLNLFETIRSRKFKTLIGLEKKILIEGMHPKNKTLFLGRSEENISVSVIPIFRMR